MQCVCSLMLLAVLAPINDEIGSVVMLAAMESKRFAVRTRVRMATVFSRLPFALAIIGVLWKPLGVSIRWS